MSDAGVVIGTLSCVTSLKIIVVFYHSNVKSKTLEEKLTE